MTFQITMDTLIKKPRISKEFKFNQCVDKEKENDFKQEKNKEYDLQLLQEKKVYNQTD